MRSHRPLMVQGMLTLAVLIAVPPALVTAQTPGEAADALNKLRRDLDDLKKKVDGLQETLNAATKQLEALDKLPAQVNKNTQDIAKLVTAQDLEAIKEELAKLQAALPKQLAKDIEECKEGISKVQTELSKLQQVERRAFSLPETLAATATGQVQLINAWMTPMTVVVDGLSYRLLPGDVRTVSRAAGNFTYEVLGLQPPVTRTVVAGRTFTIQIGPR